MICSTVLFRKRSWTLDGGKQAHMRRRGFYRVMVMDG